MLEHSPRQTTPDRHIGRTPVPFNSLRRPYLVGSIKITENGVVVVLVADKCRLFYGQVGVAYYAALPLGEHIKC